MSFDQQEIADFEFDPDTFFQTIEPWTPLDILDQSYGIPASNAEMEMDIFASLTDFDTPIDTLPPPLPSPTRAPQWTDYLPPISPLSLNSPAALGPIRVSPTHSDWPPYLPPPSLPIDMPHDSFLLAPGSPPIEIPHRMTLPQFAHLQLDLPQPLRIMKSPPRSGWVPEQDQAMAGTIDPRDLVLNSQVDDGVMRFFNSEFGDFDDLLTTSPMEMTESMPAITTECGCRFPEPCGHGHIVEMEDDPDDDGDHCSDALSEQLSPSASDFDALSGETAFDAPSTNEQPLPPLPESHKRKYDEYSEDDQESEIEDEDEDEEMESGSDVDDDEKDGDYNDEDDEGDEEDAYQPQPSKPLRIIRKATKTAVRKSGRQTKMVDYAE